MSDPRSMILDLFAGTGSATLPFRECGKHTVVGVDIVPGPYVEIVCDVRKLPRWVRETEWDFVWASPPCTEFSYLTAVSHARGHRGPPDPEEGMKLVRSAFQEARRARWWCVENVRGSYRYIPREFGEPWLMKDAWCVWSNLPATLQSWGPWFKGVFVPGGVTWPSGSRTFHNVGSTRPRDKARIPRPLAEAVHRAVCEEKGP